MEERNVQETQVQENKMGVWPVNRLLISMSVPIMVSMLVQALYNVVDSIFVAKLSENALNAVSLAFPVQNLMIAVATVPVLVSTPCCPRVWERKTLNGPIWQRPTVYFWRHAATSYLPCWASFSPALSLLYRPM